MKELTKICTLCGEEKPVEDFYWANKKKGYRCSWCIDCTREYHKSPNARKTQAKQRQKPERKAYMASYGKIYGKTSKARATKAAYKRTPKNKMANVIWVKNNPGKINAKNRKRRLAKLQRVPKWANLKAIRQIYVNCPKGMQVDHIVPLQGKWVSGLHVENNLQYLTRDENGKKGNKFNN